MNSPLLLERVPALAPVDVLVVGAGSAGCCAALAARREGAARVLLLERYGFAGGSSPQMVDTFYGFFTPGESPRKVGGGAVLELPARPASIGRTDWPKNRFPDSLGPVGAS